MTSGPRSNRSQVADGRKRLELIEAASRVFQEKGYEGASIQDIADVLGMQKGSLYHWIQSKEDLLYWTIKQRHESFSTVAASVSDPTAPPLERLRRFVIGHTITLVSDIPKSAVFLRDFDHLVGPRRSEILRFRQRYMAVLVDVVADGQRTGAIRADYPATQLSLAILGMLNWTHTWYRPSGKWTAEQTGEFYASLVANMVRPSGQPLPD